MLKVLSNILCDLDPTVKVIGQKAGICDGVPSTSALVNNFIKSNTYGVNSNRRRLRLWSSEKTWGTSITKSGDPDQTAPKGNSPIWVRTVCFSFFVGALRTKPSDHLNLVYIWASTRENLTSGGADQPAHPRSLVRAFVIPILEMTICKLATGEISIF